MEFQEGARSDWSRYFCSQPSAGFEDSSVRLESNSDPDPYCSIWTDREQARVRRGNNRSFATDARMRLDSLKSSYGSPLPGCGTAGLVDSYKDAWDSEESQEEESALDSVELLDVEDDVQDEENWLYQTPKKQDQASDERSKSALGWCRHVLDHPSPGIEAACRSLINRLDQSSSRHFYRCPEVFHLTGNVSVDSSMDQTSGSMTHNTSDSTDRTELNLPSVSISSSYKLQDITDVHFLARLQEASLRQDYDCTPSFAPKRGAEPSYFSTTVDRADDFTAGSKFEGSSSPSRQPRLSTLSSSPSPSPSPITKLGCQSPKVSRLHQQVTQFKLLRLAQNEGASPVRTRSPLRTSLRSLQAVRNSRSLETDDYQPADAQIAYPPISGTSSVSYWSPSLSTAHIQSTGATQTARDCSTEWTLAVKRLQRSQSASPCRIPHPAKGRLSLHGRVFASPERSTAIAWARR